MRAARAVVRGAIGQGKLTTPISQCGACGTQINAATEYLVAVSYTWWTTANPNNDPVCNYDVEVTYNGVTVTVPVRDKCPSCDSTHLDLSKPAFERFAPTGQGVVNGITWKFVNRPAPG